MSRVQIPSPAFNVTQRFKSRQILILSCERIFPLVRTGNFPVPNLGITSSCELPAIRNMLVGNLGLRLKSKTCVSANTIPENSTCSVPLTRLAGDGPQRKVTECCLTLIARTWKRDDAQFHCPSFIHMVTTPVMLTSLVSKKRNVMLDNRLYDR